MFEPGSNVIFKVRCHRFRSYYEGNKFITETCKTCKITEKGGLCEQTEHFMEHCIKAGDRIAFPLYFGDEYLEISLDLENGEPLTYPYYIIAGRKAKAMCKFDDDSLPPNDSNSTGEDVEEDNNEPPKKFKDGFYAGGKWEVDENNKAKIWKLTIKKYGADPETDDVVIGAGPPA